MKKQIKYILALLFILRVSIIVAEAQIIRGETSAVLNNTYTYYFYSSTYLGYPNWQPSGGTVVSQWQSGMTYYANIRWTSTGTRLLQFAEYSEVLASLNVYVCSSGMAAGVSMAGQTSICVGNNYTYTATPTNGGTPYYVWKIDGVTKQSSGSSSFTTNQLALNSVVSVTMTSSISCVSPISATATRTITSATQPVAVSANISHSGQVCQGQQASFTVTATNGGTSPIYTWYRGGSLADNIITGNTNTYQPYNQLTTGETVSCLVTSNLSCLSGSATVWSNTITISVTALPGNPGALDANNVTASSMTARWNSVAGADYYRLDVAWDYNFTNILPTYSNLYQSGTSCAITGLSAGNSYYYRVRAVNCSGTGGNSNTITTILIPPPPSTLQINSITSTSFNAYWSASIGASSYYIDVSLASDFSSFVSGYNNLPVSGTSQNVTGLSPGNIYYYRIRAKNAWGTSTNSSSVNVLLYPPAPVSNNASSITVSSLVANWNSAYSATSYRLDVSANISFSPNLAGYSGLSVSGTSQSVTGLAAGTTYYYRIRSVNARGESSNSGTITTLTLPAAPNPNSPSSITNTSFTANWSSVTSATSYRLDVSTNAGFSPYITGYDNLTVSGTSQSVTGLSSGSYYYYRVRAVNGSGTSASSGNNTALTLPDAPSANVSSFVTASSFTASWSIVTSATSYRLDVSLYSNFSSNLAGYNDLIVGSTSQNVSGLSAGTTYYYRVRAINSSGTSVSSSHITTLTLPPPAPEILPPSDVTSTGFTAKWIPVTGITSYFLDLATDHAFINIVSGYNNLSVSGSNRVITGLTDGQIYYYRLRSYNGTSYSSNSDIGVNLDQNYVTAITITREGITSSSEIANASPGERQITTNYFDGLGRSTQQVLRESSPDTLDVVQPIAYDEFGREQLKYLPYTTSEANGLFKIDPLGSSSYTSSPQYLFYNNGTDDKIANDAKPFSQTVFEASPTNRVLQQGAPGTVWQTDSSHVQRFVYDVNDQYEVLIWRVVGDTCKNAGGEVSNNHYFYPEGKLNKTIIKDENWTSDSLNTTEEFKDMSGNVILKRSYVFANGKDTPTDTYYVYDDFGLLRYVLSPEAVKNLGVSISLTKASDIIKKYGYYYSYDQRKRMITKQIPGADSVCYVYDKRDRLVGTQDGVLRTSGSGEWLFTKYDALNRPIMTGFYPGGTSRATVQNTVDGFSGNNLFEERGSAVHGYTNRAFPNVSDSTKYYTISYFDDYLFPGVAGFDTVINISGYKNGNLYYYDRVRTQATGSKVRVLDGSATYLKSTIYYDDKYRPIQKKSDLFDATGGAEVVSNRYNFTGQIQEVKIIQRFNNVTTTVNKYYTYDHSLRLIKTEQEISGDSNGRITLASQDYNEAGQLVEKYLHKSSSAGPLQTIDYRYNIRGWLSSINDPDRMGYDLFAMAILYNNSSEINPLTTQRQYNGNISGIKWKAGVAADTVLKGYGFIYDGLNRLKSSDYGEGTGFVTSGDRYNESVGSYDLNGNIISLSRSGYEGTTSYPSYDVLTYAYLGNQLTAVEDSGDDGRGFVDGNTTATDYTYDQNGNLISDLNKSISSITYNYLNLPSEVRKDINNKVVYTYDATGVKLRKTSVISGATTYRYYAGGFEYDNSKNLALIHTDEGVVNKSGSAYTYEYFLKDHLGNTRISFSPNGTSPQLEQTTTYYPFGMIHFSSLGSDNKYLYNGKELQDDNFGAAKLDWYDYGARFYDSQIGRFTGLDPIAESFYYVTPYNYAENSPIANIDLWGLQAVSYLAKLEYKPLTSVGNTVNNISAFLTNSFGVNTYNTAAAAINYVANKVDVASNNGAAAAVTDVMNDVNQTADNFTTPVSGSDIVEGFINIENWEGAATTVFGAYLGKTFTNEASPLTVYSKGAQSVDNASVNKSIYSPKDSNGNPVTTQKTKAGNTKIDPEARGTTHTQLRTDKTGKYPQRTTFDSQGRKRADTHFTDHNEKGKTNPHKHTYYKDGRRQ